MKVTVGKTPSHAKGLGEALRRSRERQAMSIRTAARLARMSVVTWGKIENGGSARPDSLKRAGEALGVRGELVIDAAADPAQLPELETALRGRWAGKRIDLSAVSDTDLLTELNHRLVTRRTMLELSLAEQGNGHRPRPD